MEAVSEKPSIHYTAYSDESATRERYLGFGAFIAPSARIKEAETILAGFCDANGFGGRSLSWKACSPGEVDRYCRFAGLFHQLCSDLSPVDFRAMVVDTRKYPLKHEASGAATEEQGFYKFYHWFLQGSLRQVALQPAGFRLAIAPKMVQYAFNAEILEKTVGGTLRADFGVPLEFTEVDPVDPRRSRCHQLADILLGAVTYRFNRLTRDPDGTSHKRALYGTVRDIAGRDLDEDFLPGERPFNVWGWAPKGHRRWVKGAEGVV